MEFSLWHLGFMEFCKCMYVSMTLDFFLELGTFKDSQYLDKILIEYKMHIANCLSFTFNAKRNNEQRK